MATAFTVEELVEDATDEGTPKTSVYVQFDGKYFEVLRVDYDELNDSVVITAGEEAV